MIAYSDLNNDLYGIVIDIPPNESSCISLNVKTLPETGSWQVGFLPLSLNKKLWILGLSEVSIFLPMRQYFIMFISTSAIYNESMEQSEYLKNLLKRLDQATQQLSLQDHTQSPYTLSTIKFERQEFDSNVNFSKRDNFVPQEINRTVRPRSIKDTLLDHKDAVQMDVERGDNSKTMRNTPGLKFNPEKSRKKSQNKYDREPSKRSYTTKRDKKDLVEVRDKLNDIVAFLNHKIDSNPEVEEVKKVIDMKDVERKEEREKYQERESILVLPKYDPYNHHNQKQHDKHAQEEKNKYDNEHLNLKHSFDKLGDIHSSHSLHSPQKERLAYHSPQQQPIFLPTVHADPQIIYRYPTNPIILNNNQRPAILLNGKTINNNSQSNITLAPYTHIPRPHSELPIRYFPQSPPNINRPYVLNQLPMVNSSYLIPLQQKAVQPQFINPNQPSFRTITARPLSTQRNSDPSNVFKQRIAGQKPPQFPKPIVQIKPLSQQQPLEGGRLKKKTNLNNHFKEEPISRLNQYVDEAPQADEQIVSKQQLEKVLPPPKPYTNYSTNQDNPFKKSELSQSKKSSRFKAEISNEILKSIAQQSQQNHVTRNLQGSGKSSSRLMSSVNSNVYFSKVNKFQGTGSTKLKRKGIDMSSKLGYMSQYTRQT